MIEICGYNPQPVLVFLAINTPFLMFMQIDFILLFYYLTVNESQHNELYINYNKIDINICV